jgi:Predicted dehydrogenases and related proteins
MESNATSTEKPIRWGIIGTGRIAHTFAKALVNCENAIPFAAASRTRQKADAFAAEYQFRKAYGSYAELAQDPDVDVVYIATPMSSHYHDARLCLEHGKNVLCEKSVTLNCQQLEELLDLAKQNGLFFMEAMWMKCRPVYRKAMEWVREGRIGSIGCIKAGFCNLVPYNANDRLFRADCGGGALLDLGVYPLTLVHDLMGKPKKIKSHAHIRNGIALSNTILLA